MVRELLKRASIVAGQLRFVGKEADQRCERGEDPSLLTFKSIEYVPRGKVSADETLKEKSSKRGVRESMRRRRPTSIRFRRCSRQRTRPLRIHPFRTSSPTSPFDILLRFGPLFSRLKPGAVQGP
jgi:hypothetical protein